MIVKCNPEKDEETIQKMTFIRSVKVIQNGYNKYEIDELTRAWGKIPESHFEGLISVEISNSELQYRKSKSLTNGFYRNRFITLTRQLKQEFIEEAGNLPKAIARVSYHEIGHHYHENIFRETKDYSQFRKNYVKAKKDLVGIKGAWSSEKEFFADMYRGYLTNDDLFKRADKIKGLNVESLMKNIFGVK